ncbi:unnamed protein product [Agarophyton chilense]
MRWLRFNGPSPMRRRLQFAPSFYNKYHRPPYTFGSLEQRQSAHYQTISWPAHAHLNPHTAESVAFRLPQARPLIGAASALLLVLIAVSDSCHHVCANLSTDFALGRSGKVARFLKERERYELEVTAKQSQVLSLEVLPYKASVDRSLLKSLHYMGKFEKLAPNAQSFKDLTDEVIKTFVESLVKRTESDAFDPTIIESALNGFLMPTKVFDPEARITTYCADFLERLESVGCGTVPDQNTKKSVRLLCAHLQPEALRKEMRKRLEYDESLESSIRAFIKILTQEAINCQAYAVSKCSESGPQRKQQKDSQVPITKSKSSNQKPICPYPPHKEKGQRHFLKDCRDCPKEEKDKLFEELRSVKKEGVKRTTNPLCQAKDSTVLFTVTLDEKFRTTVCADIGSAATLKDTSILERARKAGVDASVVKLVPPRKFEMAAKNPDGSHTIIECTHAATIDTELHIRHGSTLVLRNLRWLVTPQIVDEPLLSRRLLEALGFDCQKVMQAAADRFGGSVDVSSILGNKCDFGTSRIGCIIDGVYHADGGIENADLNADDVTSLK